MNNRQKMRSEKPVPINAGHGNKIGNRMQPAIAALLSHQSVEAAARVIGIHPNTLSRWMKDPKFQTAYAEGRQMAFRQSIGKLQQAADLAIETVLNIMQDHKMSPGIRLRAAVVVLAYGSKRLEEIEVGSGKSRTPRAC